MKKDIKGVIRRCNLQLLITPLISFFIYSLWSHLWYLSSFTASDHTFDIFLHLQLLITPLLSFLMKKDIKGVIRSCKWRKISKVWSETVNEERYQRCDLSSFTVSDHTFVIFLHLQLVITPLLSFFIYSFWSHLWYLSSFTASDHTFDIFLHLHNKGVIRNCKWRKITKVWSQAVNEER
jgi:hypothetical protein